MPTDSTRQLPLFERQEKECSTCKEPFPINTFPPRSGSPGKYDSRCRACLTQYNREYAATHREQMREGWRRFAQKHPERIREGGNKYRATHAEKHAASVAKCKRESKEKYAEYARRYFLTHRKECNARAVQSYYRHQEKRIAASSAWAKKNHQHVAERQRPKSSERRARKRGNGGTFSKWDWERIKAQSNWTCLACGRREPDIKLHADHVVPLMLGGFNIASNLQAICGRCNAIKGPKFIDYRPDPYRI